MDNAVTDNPSKMHCACPICDCKDLKLLWKVDGYSVVQCKGCTLVFVQEAFTPQELAVFYTDRKDQVYDDDNLECLSFYYEQLRKLIEGYRTNPGRILDIGCSGGWFLDVMKGWECYGNEITKSDAATATKKHGDRIFEGSFEDYPLKPDFFDVIALQDVFDHLPQPRAMLEKCRLLLKPGGLIVIKVHNISCLYAKLTGSKFYAIIPPYHLFYYDKKTLFNALKSTGYEPVDAKYLPHLLKISTVFSRLSKGAAKSPFSRIHRLLKKTPLGEIKIRKNLRDLITVFATKT